MSDEAAPTSNQQYVSVGEVIVGKYLVERVLGVGGMAFVVSARHIDLDEHFALKFLNREFVRDKSIVERFTREAKAACMIRSEHVARVYDVGTHEGAPFIVMEHLTGRDLHDLLFDTGPVTIAEAVEYTMQTCEALASAHALGIIHRDIKPENLFLVEHGGLPSIKLLDFGISKLALTGADKSSRLTGKLTLGTPCYMSPEQIRSSSSADARSDLWSLGVVLYALLTATEAFQAGTVTETCAAVLEKDPHPLRDLRADVPEGLAAVVAKCLAKNPDDRYANVAELAQALVPFAPSRAIVSAERSSSTMKTHRRGPNGEKISARPSLLKNSSSAPPSSIDGVVKSASSMLSATPLSLSIEVPLFDPSELADDARPGLNPREEIPRFSNGSYTPGPFSTRRSRRHTKRRRGWSFVGGAVAIACLAGGVFFAQRAFDGRASTAAATARDRPQEAPAKATDVPAPATERAAAPTVRVDELPSAVPSSKRAAAASPQTAAFPQAPAAPTPAKSAKPQATKAAEPTPGGDGRDAPAATAATPPTATGAAPKVELGY